MVDGRVDLPTLDGHDGGNRLHTRGSTQAVPNHGLGRIHLDVGPVRENGAHGLNLGNVADERRCRMRVDVVDLIPIDTCTTAHSSQPTRSCHMLHHLRTHVGR